MEFGTGSCGLNIYVSYLCQIGSEMVNNRSLILLSFGMVFLQVFGWISKALYWKVEDGRYVQVGIDLVVGMEETYCLSWSLVSYLQDYGTITLNQAMNVCDWSSFGTYWLSFEDLNLGGDWKVKWDHIPLLWNY